MGIAPSTCSSPILTFFLYMSSALTISHFTSYSTGARKAHSSARTPNQEAHIKTTASSDAPIPLASGVRQRGSVLDHNSRRDPRPPKPTMEVPHKDTETDETADSSLRRTSSTSEVPSKRPNIMARSGSGSSRGPTGSLQVVFNTQAPVFILPTPSVKPGSGPEVTSGSVSAVPVATVTVTVAVASGPSPAPAPAHCQCHPSLSTRTITGIAVVVGVTGIYLALWLQFLCIKRRRRRELELRGSYCSLERSLGFGRRLMHRRAISIYAPSLVNRMWLRVIRRRGILREEDFQ